MKKILKGIYNATGPKRVMIDVCLVGIAFCIGADLGMKIMKEGGR